MEANVKGFIRNVVNSVLYDLAEKGHLCNEDGNPVDEEDLEYSVIKEYAGIITEEHLDCIIEEE